VSVSVPSFIPASLARLAGAAALLFAATLSAGAADPSPAAMQAAQTIVAGSGMSQAFDGVVPQISPASPIGEILRFTLSNPIDPATLDRRLSRNGFTSVDVRIHALGWICTGMAAS